MHRLIILVTAMTLSTACQRKPAVTAAPEPTPQPNPALDKHLKSKQNPAVDAIRGIGGIRLGGSRVELESRLSQFSKEIYNDIDNDTRFISPLAADEREWAGVPVENVSLRFEAGYIRVIKVTFKHEQGHIFLSAFRVKFGSPNDGNDYSGASWQGNDTRVGFSWGDARVFVVITSATSDRFCTEERSKRDEQKRESLDAKARKAAERF